MSRSDLPEYGRLQRFNNRHGGTPERVAWATGLLVAVLGFWYVVGGGWCDHRPAAYLVGAAAAFAAGIAVMFAAAGVIMGIGWVARRVRS